MITFLITPVKSRRDSLLFETPACKLTFDVAETPVLFDSLSVNQLKNLQSKKRESLCNVSLCGIETPFKRQSISTIDGCIDGYIDGYIDSPSPVIKLFENMDSNAMEGIFDNMDGLTPANLFNEAINKINNNNKEGFEGKEEEETTSLYQQQQQQQQQQFDLELVEDDIVTSTRHNNEFCITMLITTKQNLSQQKIYQYLIANNDNILGNVRNINIIKSCDCIPCKHRNWNNVDIRWEKQWQTQQFEFNINKQQIIDVNCQEITNILKLNGILQNEIYHDSQKTFYRKIMRKGMIPNSNKQSIRKKRKKTRLSITSNNKLKDKKIMLQHLATWSNCIGIDDDKRNNIEYIDDNDDNNKYLPLVCREDNGCSYISCETLINLINGSFDTNHLFDYFVIIDCRYQYEYLGGHINGAINVSDKLLIKLLFKANMKIKNVKSQRIAWIFHCEYSKHRGPKTCKYFRKLDRQINEYRYPIISYPHVYVLHGGYKTFWNKYKNSYYTLKNKIFQPYGYISMWNDVFDDKRFIYSQFRQNVWKKDKKKNKTKLC